MLTYLNNISLLADHNKNCSERFPDGTHLALPFFRQRLLTTINPEIGRR
jgi:hypothetical protein